MYSWEKRYQTTIFTSGTTTLDALRALEVKRFVGTTYFRGDINKIYAKYFVDAGFEILDMAGMDVDFDKVQELSSLQIYRFVKGVFLSNNKAQAIYMLGPGWRTLDIIEKLEQDLGVPVIHAVPAQCWDIQRHLHVRQPVNGFGRLIAEMPGTGISYQ
jgi:maleate isomerase